MLYVYGESWKHDTHTDTLTTGHGQLFVCVLVNITATVVTTLLPSFGVKVRMQAGIAGSTVLASPPVTVTVNLLPGDKMTRKEVAFSFLVNL